jgi:hypothetical protein
MMQRDARGHDVPVQPGRRYVRLPWFAEIGHEAVAEDYGLEVDSAEAGRSVRPRSTERTDSSLQGQRPAAKPLAPGSIFITERNIPKKITPEEHGQAAG